MTAMSTIHAEIPSELISRAQAFVGEGWARNIDDLLAEALRRFLESHTSELSETFLREDVEWGLHGRD